MLYYNFKNYQEFQELYGVIEHGNGVKSRKNKIMLSLLKSKELLHAKASFGPMSYRKLSLDGLNPKEQKYDRYFRWSGRYATNMEITLFNTNSLIELRPIIYDWLNSNASHTLSLNGNYFRSEYYETDDFCGLCEDGDERSIRYRNIEQDRIYKMRAGKFFRKLIDERPKLSALLPEAIKIWLAEDFAEEWKAYASANIKTSEYELHVDDNFADIYDSSCLSGDFGSCMTNRDYHSYYANCVTAKAAYLTNDDGNIVARCIIFPEVHVDGSDKVLRLAERQYSTGCDDTLKRQLVIALINAGEIDGYKRVGAGCSDNTAFVDINGNPLESTDLWIECKVDYDDHVSYQDSFRYYNEGRRKAYNDDGQSVSVIGVNTVASTSPRTTRFMWKREMIISGVTKWCGREYGVHTMKISVVRIATRKTASKSEVRGTMLEIMRSMPTKTDCTRVLFVGIISHETTHISPRLRTIFIAVRLAWSKQSSPTRRKIGVTPNTMMSITRTRTRLSTSWSGTSFVSGTKRPLSTRTPSKIS